MKGIVFNLLEAFIVQNWGDAAYESVLDSADLGCPFFVGAQTYPDSELTKLITTMCAQQEQDPKVALRAFGRFCFPRLAAKYPTFLEGYTDLKVFLFMVDSVVHIEVQKLLPGARTPRFEYQHLGPGRLRLNYRSERKLCALMEGLLEGAADHFGVAVEYEHVCCMHEGADHCGLEIDIKAREEAA